MPSAHGLLRKSVNDLKGFRSHNRFIILSEVKSNSIKSKASTHLPFLNF